MVHLPRQILLSVAAVGVLAVLTGCGPSGARAESEAGQTELTVALSSPSWNAGFASLAAAEREAYFEAEHLRVHFVLSGTGTAAAQQLAGGGAQAAVLTPEPVIIGAGSGLRLQVFVDYYGTWQYTLRTPAGSPVTSPTQLAGKRIGVTNAASSGATFARVAMRMNGLDPNSAIFVPLGTGAQQLTAVQRGDVDVLALWDTQYQILTNGGVRLDKLPVDGLDGLYGGGVAAPTSALAARRDVYIRLGRALVKGYYFTAANPAAAVRDLWALHPETGPAAGQSEAAALGDQIAVAEVHTSDIRTQAGPARLGQMSRDGMTRTIEFMHRAGLVGAPVAVDDVMNSGLLPEITAFDAQSLMNAAKARN